MTYCSYVGADLRFGYRNSQWDFAQTYMISDIAALQKIYGADFSTNSGNSVYRWTPGSSNTEINGEVAIDPGGSKIFATAWDGGGCDTYDLSAYNKAQFTDICVHGMFLSRSEG